MHKTGDDVEWRANREDEPQKGPQADSCRLETNPERTGEKPLTWLGLGFHGKGLVPNVYFSNTLRTTSKHTGRYQRKERALRLLRLLLAPQGKALLEDFNPCCRRVCCKLVVEGFQDAILLSDNLLNGGWCVVRLAPSTESSDCRQQIGQVAEDLELALDSS